MSPRFAINACSSVNLVDVAGNMRPFFPRHGDVSKDGRIFQDVVLNVLML